MSQLIDVEIIHDHIALITLNRPEAANAMSKALLTALKQSLEAINQQESIYCVILTGNGEKAFCAGADLKERRGMSNEQVIEAVRLVGDTVNAVEAMKMPVIAAINGVAFGGGLELALACDIRIASEQAKMGLTETSLAIIPGAGGTQRLPRLIGIGRAKQLIFTAKSLSATEAQSIGLVEVVTNRETLLDEAIEMALAIAKNGPIAIQLAKKAINQGAQTDIVTGLEIENLCYQQTIPTQDRLEGLQAFKEKRKPLYQGK
ncbi:enoyl-CoA hydratase [Ornithinibacillus contaminans]|uniref:enoyl-CoA hydratase n=1 Tax=Ornithinibacillus contaminans TaxID=694055 RepID=UPI00064DBEBB|nr:enoyl-CoA hydratase [Ornithinibacillus contaminans]